MPAARPHVIVNVAVTADGKTDTVARQGAAISSAADFARVDRLRAASDAIIVGGRTLLGDDPRLVVKDEALRQERIATGRSPNPLKVGIVSEASLDTDSRFLTYGPADILLYTTERTRPEQVRQLREQGVVVAVLGKERVDLAAALADLQRRGCEQVLVEGGGTLIAALLGLGLVDELLVYVAPLIFGGAAAPTLADGPGLAREQAIDLKLADVARLMDGGLLVHYGRLEASEG